MKNIKLAYLLPLLISTFSNAQEKMNSGCNKYIIMSAKADFDDDKKNDALVLYLQGGIVAVIKEPDHDFEKLYKIKYRDLGCVVPSDLELQRYKSYNQFVFMYLKERFGDEWQQTVNQNTIGWNAPATLSNK